MAPVLSDSASVRTVEIKLDAHVLAALCRRGRRRLRDIQSATKALLKLDRYRGVLQVVGSPGTITDVRKQLDGLTGPTIMVSAAVWAELMRTRTNPDPLEAAVARIQQQSECRVHVERGEPKTRIFGPAAKADVAERLLEELDGMCVQLAVAVADAASIELDVLQAFAEDYGVTVQVEEKQVTVLGIAGAVTEAAKAMQGSDPNENTVPLTSGSISEVARSAILSAMSDLVGKGDAVTSPLCTSNALLQDSGKGSLQGAVMSNIPSATAKPPSQKSSMRPWQNEKPNDKVTDVDAMVSSGECSICGCGASFCSSCGNSIKRIKESNGCSGCGAVRFCVYCGQPTERMLKSQQRGGTCYQPDFSDDCYDPGAIYFDVSPKPMQSIQTMQAVPVSACNTGSPMLMPQHMSGTPQMMMAPAVNMGMGFPMSPSPTNTFAMSGITSGFQAATTMLVNHSNGIQSCMVPMVFGSFE
jgi:hypothetical protein